jgi:hypothetical protein
MNRARGFPAHVCENDHFLMTYVRMLLKGVKNSRFCSGDKRIPPVAGHFRTGPFCLVFARDILEGGIEGFWFLCYSSTSLGYIALGG